jgi:hypothetical protein
MRWGYSFYTPKEELVEFEFDPDKSIANKEKHGIDFTEAQALWQDPMRVEIPARTVNEPRRPSDRTHRRQALVCRDDPTWRQNQDHLSPAITR